MISQPFFFNGAMIKALEAAVSTTTVTSGALALGNATLDTDFAQWNSANSRIDILKDGKYRLLFDSYVNMTFGHSNLTNGTLKVQLENQSATVLAKIQTFRSGSSGAPTVQQNDFSNSSFLAENGVALSGQAVGSSANSILGNGRWMWETTLNLSASNWLRFFYSSSLASPAGLQFAMSGSLIIQRVT